jgi:hypothetical protein
MNCCSLPERMEEKRVIVLDRWNDDQQDAEISLVALDMAPLLCSVDWNAICETC